MNKFLVITSIAAPNEVLRIFAKQCADNNASFIVIGDKKSPVDFNLEGCDFYSLDRQKQLSYRLSQSLPVGHYARKNLGYLEAIKSGAELLIETDDDNIPIDGFWNVEDRKQEMLLSENDDWVNIYKYFTDVHCWPRGLPLEEVLKDTPNWGDLPVENVITPIVQGLANENPDVDAVFRLTQPLPFNFDLGKKIALGEGSWCPFNTQNTAWRKEAFALLYLPSYCSFRMTDIWKSFIAQRIAWTCGWSILFKSPTVRQERNDHDLMRDFREEISGYTNNDAISKELSALNLKEGEENIFENLTICYQKMVEMKWVEVEELKLLSDWINDLESIL